MTAVKKIDVLVIGAGPAGTVSSTYLHRKGYNVLVVEKATFPRFVIGESLLPRCLDVFEKVGLLPFLEAQNYQLKKGAIFKKGNEETVFDFSEQFTQNSRPYTWQVPRAHFDNVLAEGAQTLGVEIWFNKGVESVDIQDNFQTICIVDAEGNKQWIESKFIIDASGYGRVLPRLLDLDEPSDLPVRTTVFAHIKDKNRSNYLKYQEYITYLIHDKDYTWNIPFNNGITSVGFVGENEVFDNGGTTTEEIYKNLLHSDEFTKDRYGHFDFAFEPKTLKGFSVGVKKLYGKGYVLTGNSTEFLDPIFSSGVTLATESALIAAKNVDRFLNNENVNWETEFEEPARLGINVFKTYVTAWYDKTLEKIFFAPDQNENIRKQICSILAGYVWDKENPFVIRYKSILKTIVKVMEIQS